MNPRKRRPSRIAKTSICHPQNAGMVDVDNVEYTYTIHGIFCIPSKDLAFFRKADS
jgi:hypothetical protein